MNEPKHEPLQVPQFFASVVQISASLAEISMALGVNGVPEIGGSALRPAEAVAVVRLSPQAAKLLSISLEQILRVYEERFAKIDLGPDAERLMLEAAAAVAEQARAAARAAGPTVQTTVAKPPKAVKAMKGRR
jgi:hypothetical protein